MNHTQHPFVVDPDQVERSPFSVVRHLLLPTFGLAVFISLGPNKPLRFLGFLSYVLWCVNATKYTAGIGFENYGMGCQLGGACLVAFYNLLLSDPLAEWRHRSEPGKLMGELPLWKRVYWTLCATFGHRGIDWSFEVSTTMDVYDPSHLLTELE